MRNCFNNKKKGQMEREKKRFSHFLRSGMLFTTMTLNIPVLFKKYSLESDDVTSRF